MGYGRGGNNSHTPPGGVRRVGVIPPHLWNPENSLLPDFGYGSMEILPTVQHY